MKQVVHKGEQSVEELSQLCRVSLQTIRADIRFLTERGQVFRTHGGVAAFQRENVAYNSRELHNRAGKERIGKEVAQRLLEFSSCFLGTGTTVEMVSRSLSRDVNLEIYTNNLYAASYLCEHPNVSITIAGGKLRKRDKDIIGGDALRFFQRYRVQAGVVSVGGVDSQGYLYDYNDTEVMAREALCTYSQFNILVVDSSKLGVKASCQIGHVSDFDLVVSDFEPTQEALAQMEGDLINWKTV
ncbi:DeoR/GlpR family DNA-binding transcription regulator [Vibrio sp. VB16]|uniref:DeoR/GlpR family DNA-binding transcription regulator n=1 Tax=Vibrio sp. VB16 TaxID=2785746 RepID=UPI00189F7FF0|nr:DeoR/GlpR family DNA-binding transcription regulator [Vibrio sp. VB16]UGA53587.1 DeoR/GlpR family DNA-binding transcription regulator [Vibrio sp. VB16]